ncbi:DUF58 domain-containing protein [Rhodanobacter glycinis]|uniref:DUF58 domain-containing protein n=1 Tax=Rhodanobacter glycinis TaxID=582702 RepID=A0A502FN84_9GAMM|nr:DUF58 domain-containing protein [Rhodanobacter glycinis]TPG10164.1 DUF58 domain-containing protein [Rhodanobacter glycinis]TPG50925.1 DUF58 domain-containing protein [Rhodanobacter glycinis]
MRGMLQRIQRWAERRLPALTRYRRPESLPIELHRRRIYIVPSGFGIGFSALLAVMLVGALNYANNAALLLTCLLGASSAASMLVAFRTLDGVRLSHIRSGHAIAGQSIELTLAFDSSRARNAIRLDLADSHIAFALEANASAQVKLTLPTMQRGWQPLPRLRLWSSWPLGLFRAWSWLHPDQSVLVWPRPEAVGPSPHAPANDARHMRLHRGDELAALRDYRVGDPQRHIAWKASARHDNLMVKDFEQPQSRPQWQLDWRQLGGLDNEARIARLARWLNEAQAQRCNYSLWLPGDEIAGGSGPLHYARCMNALAQLP